MVSVPDFFRGLCCDGALQFFFVLDVLAGGVPACFFGKGGMCCECCEEGVFGC